MPTVTPSQIRGARGMLGWSMVDLARAAGVSVATVKRIEGGGPLPLSDDIRSAVGAAFQAAGVSFRGEGDGVSVKLTAR